MPNGVTPAGLIGKGMRLTGARGALGISDIDASAMQVLNMLSEYSTKLSERRLSGGEQATKVEKEQKKKGDLWGYGSGAAAFAALLVLGIDPKTASSVSGITSAAVRKWAEDQARLDVGVGGISLGAGELPLPPKPKYYKSQYGKLPAMRGEAKFDLESLYQAGRQMALPRALSTGYNVYRGGNLLSDVYGGIKNLLGGGEAPSPDVVQLEGSEDWLSQYLDAPTSSAAYLEGLGGNITEFNEGITALDRDLVGQGMAWSYPSVLRNALYPNGGSGSIGDSLGIRRSSWNPGVSPFDIPQFSNTYP